MNRSESGRSGGGGGVATPGTSTSRDGQDLVIKEEPNSPTKEKDDLAPKSRPRSKSDKFTRPTKKQVVDVYKQVCDNSYFLLSN